MTSIHLVHAEINEEGAKIANQMTAHDPRIPPQFINPWRAHEYDLGIYFAEGFLRHPNQEIVEALREIGAKAMKEALTSRQDLFVGLILGESKKGRNYFDEHHGEVNR